MINAEWRPNAASDKLALGEKGTLASRVQRKHSRVETQARSNEEGDEDRYQQEGHAEGVPVRREIGFSAIQNLYEQKVVRRSKKGSNQEERTIRHSLLAVGCWLLHSASECPRRSGMHERAIGLTGWLAGCLGWSDCSSCQRLRLEASNQRVSLMRITWAANRCLLRV